MSMDTRMTDSAAGSQREKARPRLTRHVNNHMQTELTWRYRHKAKGGMIYKKGGGRGVLSGVYLLNELFKYVFRKA